jgi:hypothetical protein
VFRLDGNHIFEVLSLEKSVQNWLKNSIEKKRKKVEIYLKIHSMLGSPGDFWAPLGDFSGIKNQVFFYEGPNIVSKSASGDI